MLEVNGGSDYRVVNDGITDDLSGSRTSDNGATFETVAQFFYDITGLNERSSAEDEYDILLASFAIWQVRLPALDLRPSILCCFHACRPC
jgi:hypothetical protein